MVIGGWFGVVVVTCAQQLGDRQTGRQADMDMVLPLLTLPETRQGQGRLYSYAIYLDLIYILAWWHGTDTGTAHVVHGSQYLALLQYATTMYCLASNRVCKQAYCENLNCHFIKTTH